MSQQTARRIREIVAEQLGGRDFQHKLSHKDIMNIVQWPDDLLEIADEKFTTQVSSALGWWAESRSIVRGYRLHNAASGGSNRKYELEPITRQPDRYVTTPNGNKAQHKAVETFEVIKRTAAGSAILEDAAGDLWIAKKVNL